MIAFLLFISVFSSDFESIFSSEEETEVGSVCGDQIMKGVKIEDRECTRDITPVYENAKSVAFLTMGCTAWKVRNANATRGDLYLTVNHCVKKHKTENKPNPVDLVFDYIIPRADVNCGNQFDFDFDRFRNPTVRKEEIKDLPTCGATVRAWSTMPFFHTKGLHSKHSLDEYAIIEVTSPCPRSTAAKPIKLYVGAVPDNEPIYVIGHPAANPMKVALRSYGSHDPFATTQRTQTCVLSNKRIPEARRVNNVVKPGFQIQHHCDTMGGNSGSPIFSARTHQAIGIHRSAGCTSERSNFKNQGILLSEPRVLAGLKAYEIDTSDVELAPPKMDYTEPAQCPLFPFVDSTMTSVTWSITGQLATPVFYRSLAAGSLACKTAADEIKSVSGCQAAAKQLGIKFYPRTTVGFARPKGCSEYKRGATHFVLWHDGSTFCTPVAGGCQNGGSIYSYTLHGVCGESSREANVCPSGVEESGTLDVERLGNKVRRTTIVPYLFFENKKVSTAEECAQRCCLMKGCTHMTFQKYPTRDGKYEVQCEVYKIVNPPATLPLISDAQRILFDARKNLRKFETGVTVDACKAKCDASLSCQGVETKGSDCRLVFNTDTGACKDDRKFYKKTQALLRVAVASAQETSMFMQPPTATIAFALGFALVLFLGRMSRKNAPSDVVKVEFEQKLLPA